MNMLRHQSQRAFKILEIEYLPPLTEGRKKRRTQEWQGSPDEKKAKKSTPVSSRIQASQPSTSTALPEEDILIVGVSEDDTFNPPSRLAARLGPKVDDDYEVPPVFTCVGQFLDETNRFLITRASESTENLKDYQKESKQAEKIIRLAQMLAMQLEKQAKEADMETKGKEGKIKRLETEIAQLKAEVAQSGGSKRMNAQRQYLSAIHCLSREALRTAQQPNTVDVKVTFSTNNEERVIYEGQILEGEEIEESKISSKTTRKAQESKSPKPSETQGSKKTVKRTTLPKSKASSFTEALSEISSQTESHTSPKRLSKKESQEALDKIFKKARTVSTSSSSSSSSSSSGSSSSSSSDSVIVEDEKQGKEPTQTKTSLWPRVVLKDNLKKFIKERKEAIKKGDQGEEKKGDQKEQMDTSSPPPSPKETVVSTPPKRKQSEQNTPGEKSDGETPRQKLALLAKKSSEKKN